MGRILTIEEVKVMGKILLVIVLVLIMAGMLNAASSVTETYTHFGSGIYELILDWMSGADSTFTSYTTKTTVKGQLLQAITYTDSTATGKDTADNYDITVTASDGSDLFGSALTNRDSLNTEYALPLLGSALYEPIVDSKLTIAITNVKADSTTGRIVILFQGK